MTEANLEGMLRDLRTLVGISLEVDMLSLDFDDYEVNFYGTPQQTIPAAHAFLFS